LTNNEAVVAIIDDDAELGSALKRLLTTEGYHTELFSSADEFLRVANVSKVNCFIIDVQLPGMSGVELGRLLQAKGLNVPTIFITASQDPVIRAEALKLGCVAYLLKPFRSKQLLAAMELATGTTGV
jgi:FixJ family two-component response regulator